jgi:hypothetical protein
MSMLTLHDKARTLGLGAMYEKHWGRGEFRDLFDDGSPDWPGTPVAEKVIDLRAFEAAGISVTELIDHYRETLGQQPDGEGVLGRLPATLWSYREAGYAPALPADVGRAVDARAQTRG